MMIASPRKARGAISERTEMNKNLCDAICDYIIKRGTQLRVDEADHFTQLAQLDDPRLADHAAHIRDAIRDNTELEFYDGTWS